MSELKNGFLTAEEVMDILQVNSLSESQWKLCNRNKN